MPSAIRSPRRLTPSEAQISKMVRDCLDAERIFWVRQNAGAQVIVDAQRKRRMIRMARAGAADILAIVASERCDRCRARYAPGAPRSYWCARHSHTEFVPLHLEIKAPEGRQSDAQAIQQARVEAMGHMYRIIRSAEDLRRALEEARR